MQTPTSTLLTGKLLVNILLYRAHASERRCYNNLWCHFCILVFLLFSFLFLFKFQCTIRHVKDNERCPYEGCLTKAKLTDKKLKLFQAILDKLFKEYSVNVDTGAAPDQGDADKTLTISLLTGESIEVPYSSSMEVLELKRKIMEQLNHDIIKQRLLYNDMELKVSIYNT